MEPDPVLHSQKWKWKWCWFIGTLVLATHAWANVPADENWGSSFKALGTPRSGGLRLVYAGLVCSNASAGDCNIWDFGHARSRGQGDLIVLYAPDDDQGFTCAADSSGDNVCVFQTPGADCNAATTFTLRTGPIRTAGSSVPPVGATRAVATVTTVVTEDPTLNYLVLNTRYTPLDRYLFVSAALGATCNNNDLMIEIYEDTGS